MRQNIIISLNLGTSQRIVNTTKFMLTAHSGFPQLVHLGHSLCDAQEDPRTSITASTMEPWKMGHPNQCNSRSVLTPDSGIELFPGQRAGGREQRQLGSGHLRCQSHSFKQSRELLSTTDKRIGCPRDRCDILRAAGSQNLRRPGCVCGRAQKRRPRLSGKWLVRKLRRMLSVCYHSVTGESRDLRAVGAINCCLPRESKA